MIGVAEISLNIQLVCVRVSLTHNQILEHRNNRSGRSFDQYSMDECMHQPDIELHIGRQEYRSGRRFNQYSMDESRSQPDMQLNIRKQE